MRVIEDIKFEPLLAGDGNIVSYLSRIRVEVPGQVFEAKREMLPEEYERTFPLMRDYFHEMLKKDIMKQIEKKIFVEGAK